jgi:hypothetical protein
LVADENSDLQNDGSITTNTGSNDVRNATLLSTTSIHVGDNAVPDIESSGKFRLKEENIESSSGIQPLSNMSQDGRKQMNNNIEYGNIWSEILRIEFWKLGRVPIS